MLGLLKGLHATINHLFTRKVTVQYPEVRHELPERSRGLIRLRLKPDAMEPRCISCTFCEQVCPSVAIKIMHQDKQPEKVWTLDAGAGPMLSYFNHGEKPLGLEEWPENNTAKAAPERGGCLASSLLDAGELSPTVLAKTASRNGVWLSQIFGVATFYDQLRPDGAAGERPAEAAAPEASVVPDTPAVLLANHGSIDPEKIDDYAKAGGYKAAMRVLSELSPAEVIEEITASGLRGRGGAGYPTGAKWQLAHDSETTRNRKYVVCNADEGDRGSAKDRLLLESNPHGVIEGMIVAGYAIGASEGIIYAGAHNELALKRIRLAVEQAEEHGFLDDEISGTNFTFTIDVRAVPDSFIGGEETVVLTALEGGRPMPDVRPPWPAEKGLYGKPTVVENVETLAAVPWILANDARAFRSIGAEHAPGTRLFTLTGAVASPGIYEAPLNITLKKLVEAAGGFTGEPRAAFAGSTGGGFLSPGLFDIPLDYDSIAETGGDISSGVIQVFGAEECVVDMVRDCLAFSADQSCGKCIPCRLGTWRLVGILDKLCAGRASEMDLQIAEELAQDIADGALCGLGRGSVKPLLTGLKFFRQEFVDHMGREASCGAGKCAVK